MSEIDRYDEIHAELASGEGMPEAPDHGGNHLPAVMAYVPGSGGSPAAPLAEN